MRAAHIGGTTGTSGSGWPHRTPSTQGQYSSRPRDSADLTHRNNHRESDEMNRWICSTQNKLKYQKNKWNRDNKSTQSRVKNSGYKNAR